MKEQARSRIATGLDRTGLLRPAARIRESWLAMRTDDGPEVGPDGLPLPPPRLRLLVDGRSGEADYFMIVGAQMQASIAAAVEDSGAPLADMGAILDFGCGCGRVARHWASVAGPDVHGCDYNPELIGWCSRNLPFLRTLENELDPPTPYESGSFDLIYALSVLSHLSEPLQHAWIAEFRRLLKPGGRLVISVLGDAARWRLPRQGRESFDRGELVVERPRMSGRNACTAYHPRAYVTEQLFRGFDDVAPFDLGGGTLSVMQDGYVASCGDQRESPRRSGS